MEMGVIVLDRLRLGGSEILQQGVLWMYSLIFVMKFVEMEEILNIMIEMMGI